MSNEALRVYIVDDDASSRLMVGFQFDGRDDRSVEFPDGDACIDALETPPDLLILDIDMPGTDGIAVCRHLRNAGCRDTQVIFVSAHGDLDTRLTAYDAGGDDFIVKPFAPQELERKIEIARRAIEKHRSAASQARNAQDAAFAAMATMSEMGITLDFLRRSFACATMEQLADAAGDALQQYGCPGLVYLGDDQDACFRSASGECSELERSLLCHARTLERIFQFHNRLAVNYPHVTFLVPDLPVSDASLVGRLRDHLAVLAEGTEARYTVMCGEKQRLLQAEALIGAVAELTDTLENIDQRQEAQRLQLMDIAHRQLTALTNAFVRLGLSEAQEESLVALTQSGIDNIANAQNSDLSMSAHLRSVITRLKTATTVNDNPPGASPRNTNGSSLLH